MPEFDEKVTIPEVTSSRETDKAILVEIEGEEFWIPKSQIDDDSEVYEKNQHGELVVSAWLAKQKGF